MRFLHKCYSIGISFLTQITYFYLLLFWQIILFYRLLWPFLLESRVPWHVISFLVGMSFSLLCTSFNRTVQIDKRTLSILLLIFWNITSIIFAIPCPVKRIFYQHPLVYALKNPFFPYLYTHLLITFLIMWIVCYFNSCHVITFLTL